MTTPRRAWLLHLAALPGLAGVFALYFQPDVVVDLAVRLWSCL